jgi:uncharacterized GH25 family protein
MKTCFSSIFLLGITSAVTAFAHDIWVQTNTSVVRSGDAIYIDLMLGNHGNDHRDFKLAGKPSLDGSTVVIIGPDNTIHDLKPSFVDRGYAPKEGFWSAQFEPVKPGLYLVAQASDQIASYAPERVVRSSKTLFLVSADLDRVPADVPGYARVMGYPLELVPLTNPVAPMGPGTPIRVKLIFHGKPLVDEKVSFIPLGETLKSDFDSRYERRTDTAGSASFEPKEANYYLIVAHHLDTSKTGPGYKSTNYSATLTVLVPAICPCCGE